jgi:hypothetical protein
MGWARRKGWTAKFMTFTWKSSDLAAGTTREAATRRRLDVAHFVAWFRRRYGKDSFEYLRVAENHQSGKVHLHLVVVAPFVLQADLSKQWEINARGAWKLDVEAIGMKCPNCWPGPGATRAEKRRSMIVPPPGKGKCRGCGYRPDWSRGDVVVAEMAAKELGKYLSKSVPVSYLGSRGRRQPIARSKGWLKECGSVQPPVEPEPVCKSCHVPHRMEVVRRDDPEYKMLLEVAEEGGYLFGEHGPCGCWDWRKSLAERYGGPGPPGDGGQGGGQ